VSDAKVAQRLRLALDMYQFGEQMYVAALRRRDPHASPEAIAAMLQAWREYTTYASGGLGGHAASSGQ
jgi:Rv0078B-related antitoxin